MFQLAAQAMAVMKCCEPNQRQRQPVDTNFVVDVKRRHPGNILDQLHRARRCWRRRSRRFYANQRGSTAVKERTNVASVNPSAIHRHARRRFTSQQWNHTQNRKQQQKREQRESPNKSDASRSPETPVLRYSEEPGSIGVRPGPSDYIRAGVFFKSHFTVKARQSPRP